MADVIIIIPCGFLKVDKPTIAQDLYIGPYFRSNLAWAKSVAPEGQIYILSAKHGLMPLHAVVAPYNLKMGQPGSVSALVIKDQASRLNLTDGRRVYGIGGKLYLDKLRSVFPDLRCPVEGKSIGVSMSILKKNRGRLPG